MNVPLRGECILLFGTWLPPTPHTYRKIFCLHLLWHHFYRYYSEWSWNSNILNIIFKKVNIQIYLKKP